LLRFVAALALLGGLVSLMSTGAPIPLWLAAVLLLGGVVLLLYRGNLARKIIAIIGALVFLSTYWRAMGLGAIAIIGVVALIILAVSRLMSPFWKGRG